METAVEWLMRMLEGQKDKPFNYDEWKIAFEHAKDMEKQYYIENKKTDNNNNSRLHL
jgi:hypothetical protein